MDIYLKINELMKENKTKLKEISSFVNMSSTGFKQTLERKTLRIDTLKKIAEYYNKNILYFFEEKEIYLTINEVDYKEKYFSLLEKYTELLEKISILQSNT